MLPVRSMKSMGPGIDLMCCAPRPSDLTHGRSGAYANVTEQRSFLVVPVVHERSAYKGLRGCSISSNLSPVA